MSLTRKTHKKAAISALLAATLTFGTLGAFGGLLGTAEENESGIDLDENIMLSIFWPPTPDYITDEQYRLISEAGINWIMGAGEETLATPENQEKMLSLCEKYGIKMILNDGTFGANLKNKSESYVSARVDKYKDSEALGGFYILDEPYNANEYVDAYLNLKKAYPNGYMHLNFLPGGAYISDEIYRAQLNDWCRLCEAGGYPVDYLMFDCYPFGLEEGSMDRSTFYTNIRAVHDVALENGVRSGTYIQAVRQTVAYRRPTASEMRYEMYSALAFGFKQLSFFTWFTPVNRSEPFEDGIISPDGVPNEHYETVKTLGGEILNIGSTLVKCEALEVYLNGNDTWGQPSIPKDFFVQPQKKDQSYTLSFMKHKESGRNYLMIVNNDFTNASNVDLTLDGSISTLYEVSREDGSLTAIEIADGKLHLELEAGDAAFFALPEGLDFEKSTETSVNLAEGALITATQSLGSGGYYLSFLNDGRRFAEDGIMGWRSTDKKDISLVIDLKAEQKFNRVDLYPEGTLFERGENFPGTVKISVSSDGENYTAVKTVGGIKDQGNALSIKLDDVQSARYIKLDLSDCPGKYFSLCEIEVYNDGGDLPDAEIKDPLKLEGVRTYKKGEDLAHNRPVYPSSTTPEEGFRGWGWAADFINNGVDGQGWTSNVKIHYTPDATEYIIIDLEDVFAVERVVVQTHGVFPEDFSIEMSTDGKNWTTIASETGAKDYPDKTELTFTTESGEGVVGRFLRFKATKLRGTAADGYMLQLGNISAYGEPYCDREELRAAVELYRQRGGDMNETAYTDATSALEKEYLTQTQADRYAERLTKIMPLEGTILPDTDLPDIPDISDGDIGHDDEKPKTATIWIAAAAAVALTAGVVLLLTKRKKKDRK